MYTQHDAKAMLANRAQTTSMVGQAAFYPGSKFSQPAATLNVDDKTSIGPHPFIHRRRVEIMEHIFINPQYSRREDDGIGCVKTGI